MLKCIFIGRRNNFNQYFVDWLATQVDLQAVVWADRSRFSWSWRWRWLKRARKRWGLFGTADRILYRIVALRRNGEKRCGWMRMAKDIRAAQPVPSCGDHVEQLFTHSVNTPEIEALAKRMQCDIIIANCVAQLISDRIVRIPRLGLYIYHEGLTPEYRGQHTVMWAVANGDDDKVGYTLLRANDRFDAGEVYAQGRTQLDPLATSLGYVGHWALFEGLHDVKRVIEELEAGTAKPIDTSGRKNGLYSYFPYSQMRRINRRRRQKGLRVGPTTVTTRSA